MWSALEGSRIDGRYAILHHIATGGMAAVFSGWDERLDRPVAIKVLRHYEESDRTAVARFRREAESAAMLNHPNIVRVFDFFEDEAGHSFLIMELVEGPNLKQYLRRHERLPIAEALAVAEHVCAALQAAHDRGFVHRDIKPQNILLDPSGRAKLTDFGIVHVGSGATLTSGGLVLGTADYIAPEQARGDQLGPASDIYALGVVLYEMLTGHVPFVGPTAMSVAMQHASAPVLPPSRLVPGLPRYVEAIVLRALRKAPEQRYRSALVMGVALRLARQTLAAERAQAEQPRAEVAEPIPTLALAGSARGAGAGWPADAEEARGAPPGARALPTSPLTVPEASTHTANGDDEARHTDTAKRTDTATAAAADADGEATYHGALAIAANAAHTGARGAWFGGGATYGTAWRSLLVVGGAAVLGAGAVAADLWLLLHGIANPLPLP
ncbi:MAG TPA: protein kinase [Ktedonobacterales bacterium]|jgi:serine/threonine-protein kinase